MAAALEIGAMRSLAFSAALLSLLAVACIRTPDPSSSAAPASVPGVALAAERSGGAVRLTLTNRSNGPVGYNLCTSSLLRRTADGWSVVPTDLMCTMEIRTLQPGGNDTFPYPIPADLAAGDYAWQNAVEVPFGGPRRTVMSNPVRLP